MSGARRAVRLSPNAATLIHAALSEWIGYLEAGGWSHDDAEAEQLLNAEAARQLLISAIVRAQPIPSLPAAPGGTLTERGNR